MDILSQEYLAFYSFKQIRYNFPLLEGFLTRFMEFPLTEHARTGVATVISV